MDWVFTLAHPNILYKDPSLSASFIILSLIQLVLFFVLLGICSSDYLCPNVARLAESSSCSQPASFLPTENNQQETSHSRALQSHRTSTLIAILLSWSNSAPDLFSNLISWNTTSKSHVDTDSLNTNNDFIQANSTVSLNSDSIASSTAAALSVGEVLGASGIILCIVIGSIFIIMSNTTITVSNWQRSAIMKDLMFTLFAMIILGYISLMNRVSLMVCLLMVGTYIFYLVTKLTWKPHQRNIDVNSVENISSLSSQEEQTESFPGSNTHSSIHLQSEENDEPRYLFSYSLLDASSFPNGIKPNLISAMDINSLLSILENSNIDDGAPQNNNNELVPQFRNENESVDLVSNELISTQLSSLRRPNDPFVITSTASSPVPSPIENQTDIQNEAQNIDLGINDKPYENQYNLPVPQITVRPASAPLDDTDTKQTNKNDNIYKKQNTSLPNSSPAAFRPYFDHPAGIDRNTFLQRQDAIMQRQDSLSRSQESLPNREANSVPKADSTTTLPDIVVHTEEDIPNEQYDIPEDEDQSTPLPSGDSEKSYYNILRGGKKWLLHHVFPQLQDFDRKSKFQIILSIMTVPFTLLLKISCPQPSDSSDYDIVTHKYKVKKFTWIRLFSQAIICPLFSYQILLCLLNKKIPLLAKSVPLTVYILLLVFLIINLYNAISLHNKVSLSLETSSILEAKQEQRRMVERMNNIIRIVYLLIGILNSILWISMIANALIEMLELYQQLTGWSKGILGLTVFAWGNSISDLISNISMCKLYKKHSLDMSMTSSNTPLNMVEISQLPTKFFMISCVSCIGGVLLNSLGGIGFSGVVAMLFLSKGTNLDKNGGKVWWFSRYVELIESDSDIVDGVISTKLNYKFIISSGALIMQVLILLSFFSGSGGMRTFVSSQMRIVGFFMCCLWGIATLINIGIECFGG